MQKGSADTNYTLWPERSIAGND